MSLGPHGATAVCNEGVATHAGAPVIIANLVDVSASMSLTHSEAEHLFRRSWAMCFSFLADCVLKSFGLSLFPYRIVNLFY